MQAQAHFQVVRHVVDDGLDPQAALDAARFRVLRRPAPGRSSPASPPRSTTCARAATTCAVADAPHGFGVGQMILADDDALVGGSDGRADGHAAGL